MCTQQKQTNAAPWSPNVCRIPPNASRVRSVASKRSKLGRPHGRQHRARGTRHGLSNQAEGGQTKKEYASSPSSFLPLQLGPLGPCPPPFPRKWPEPGHLLLAPRSCSSWRAIPPRQFASSRVGTHQCQAGGWLPGSPSPRRWPARDDAHRGRPAADATDSLREGGEGGPGGLGPSGKRERQLRSNRNRFLRTSGFGSE